MGKGSSKEIIFAIIIGLITGLGFSYFIYRYNKNRPVVKLQKVQIIPKQNKTGKSAVQDKITQIAFDNFNLQNFTSTNPYVLKGKGPKGTILIVLDEKNQQVEKISDKEIFSLDLDLNEGENTIFVGVIYPSGKKEVNEYIIIYNTP